MTYIISVLVKSTAASCLHQRFYHVLNNVTSNIICDVSEMFWQCFSTTSYATFLRRFGNVSQQRHMLCFRDVLATFLNNVICDVSETFWQRFSTTSYATFLRRFWQRFSTTSYATCLRRFGNVLTTLLQRFLTYV